MVCVIEDKTLDKNKLIIKILVCILLAMFCSPMIGYTRTENDNGINQHNSSVINEEVLPDHLVEAIILFDEIYDINISKGSSSIC